MRGRLIIILIAAGCAAVALTSLALGATAAIYDFNGGHGKYTSQVRPSGSKYYVGSITLTCSKSSYVAAMPKASLSSSGAFSYSGKATLFSGSNYKPSKTTLKASGKISITKKNGTVKASTTVKGCKSFSGRLTGFILPGGD